MKQDEISKLFQRYLTASKKGIEPYFDAEEIDAILDSFEEKEDYTFYEALLRLGLRLHPDNPDLKIRQCKFYLYNEDYEQALNLLDSIAGAEGEDIDMIRLECYCTLDQYPKARAYIDRMIAEDSEYLEDIFEFVTPILCDLDMILEAREVLDRALPRFPDNLVLKEELCFVLEMEGEYEEGIRVCNELLDRVPYSYDYWFTLGRLYSLKSDFDNAIEAFDFALAAGNDSDVEVTILKAFCLFMNENYEKAIEVYSEIKTDDAQIDDRLQSLVAECYIKLNNYEKAHALLKELITRQTTDDPAFYISYIRCCIETGRESEASQVLVKAADTFPRNVRILTLLALSYLEKGREDLAIQITDKVIRQINDSIRNGNIDGIQNGEELLRESMNLFEGGDFERTVRYYKKILLLSSNLSVTHFNLALAYFSLGDMEHFNEHYRQISLKEMDDFLEKNNFPQPGKMKHIPPEDLTKEYLSNKNNCN